MNKEEYIKYVENNEELNRVLEINSSINTICNILISKKICTLEEINNLKQQYKNQSLEESYSREKKEDLEAVKRIKDLFGGFWNNE